jgi:hypothetical protein
VDPNGPVTYSQAQELITYMYSNNEHMEAIGRVQGDTNGWVKILVLCSLALIFWAYSRKWGAGR